MNPPIDESTSGANEPRLQPGPPVLDDEGEGRLLEVLNDAQRLWFLGRGPVERHVSHGLGFAAAWAEVDPTMAMGADRSPRRIADVGSGGGVPGLVLAMASEAHLVLVDNKTRRTDWLSEAAYRLGVDDRVSVVARPAEEAGQDPEWRGWCAAAGWWWSASRPRPATAGPGWSRPRSVTRPSASSIDRRVTTPC